MKRIFYVLLSFLMLFAFTSNAFALEAQPRWSYVTKTDGTIVISNSGTASIDVNGSALTNGINKVSVTASLQQFKDSRWTEIKSWSKVESSRSVRFSKSYSVAHGYSYRLVVIVKAYDGSTLKETATYTKDYGYFR